VALYDAYTEGQRELRRAVTKIPPRYQTLWGIQIDPKFLMQLRGRARLFADLVEKYAGPAPAAGGK